MKSIMKSLFTKAIFTFFILVCVFNSPAFAVFCSKCGYKAADNSTFCSSCGSQLDSAAANNKPSGANTLEIIEQKFAPVNDFEVFVFTSNYLTCIAKYPEFQILYSKNKPDIEAIEKTADKREKEIISYYYQKWEILKTLQEVWSPSSGSALRKQAYMIQYSGILKYINEIILKLKNNAPSLEVLEMKSKLTTRMAVYHVKTNFLLVSNLKLPKGQPVGIKDIADDKIEVIHLGVMAQGKASIVGPIHIDSSSLSEPISGWITKEEFEKRTDYSDLIKSK